MQHRFFTPLIAALVALSPLAMDSYLPAIPSLAAHFGVTSHDLSWTVSNFLLGLAVGQLLGGAVADQKGRRPVLLLGLLVFGISSLLLVYAQWLWLANLWRLFQGFAGGIMMVAASAVVRDVTAPDKLAGQIAQIFFVVMLTPIVAPIVGAALLPLGWQSIFWLDALAALAVLIPVWLWLAETHTAAPVPLSLRGALAQYAYVWRFERSGRRLARWRALSLCCSSLLGLVFVTVSSPLLMDHYGLSAQQFPYAFGCFAVSILVGNRIGKWLLNHYRPLQIFTGGQWLQLAALSGLLLGALLWTPPLWLFLTLIMLAIGASAAIGPSGSALYLNLLDKHFGSATAFENTLRFALGALLGSLATALPLDLVLSTSLIMAASLLVSVFSHHYTRRLIL